MPAGAQLEAVARALLEVAGCAEVDVPAAAAGACDRRRRQRTQQRLDDPECRLGVMLEDGEPGRAQEDAHVVALAPAGPLASGEAGLDGPRLRPAGAAPLAVGADECPGELRVPAGEI